MNRSDKEKLEGSLELNEDDKLTLLKTTQQLKNEQLRKSDFNSIACLELPEKVEKQLTLLSLPPFSLQQLSTLSPSEREEQITLSVKQFWTSILEWFENNKKEINSDTKDSILLLEHVCGNPWFTFFQIILLFFFDFSFQNHFLRFSFLKTKKKNWKKGSKVLWKKIIFPNI